MPDWSCSVSTRFADWMLFQPCIKGGALLVLARLAGVTNDSGS
jgi:hypothetical protein